MAEPQTAPAPVRLYDRKTGLATDFHSPEEAQQAFVSGTHGVRKGQQIHVALSDGGYGTVTGAKDLTAVFQQGGGIATPGQYRAAELEAKHGGIVGGLKAAGLGAARGLTVGLSDVALRGLAPGVADEAAELKEVHPNISTGAEIAGAVAPALFSGGGTAGASGARAAVGAARAAEVGVAGARAVEVANVAGRGAKAARGLLSAAPSNIVAHAGEGIEAVVRSALGGAGKSFVARAGTKAGALAARGLVEGGIYGAGGEVSEAALGNHELNGEKLLSAIGHGALFGAVSGGALGVLGEVGSTGLRKAAPWLNKAADMQAWKALNPLKKFSEEAAARAGGEAAVGATLRKYGLVAFGDSVEHLVPKIRGAVDEVGEKIGAIASGSKAKVSAGELMGSIEEVIAPLRKKAGFENIVRSLDSYRNSLGEKLGLMAADGAPIAGNEALLFSKGGGAQLTVQQVIDQRRALDALAYKEAKSLDPSLRVEFLRAIRGGVEDLETRAILESAPSGEMAAEYKSLKGDYQRLKLAEKAAEKSTSRMATNRNFSLTDYLATAGGLASGHGALGLAAGVGNKVLRERGNASASVILDKLANLGAIRNALAEVDQRIATGVEGALKSRAIGPRKVKLHAVSPSTDAADEYESRVSMVRDAVAEPHRSQAILQPMLRDTPATGQGLAMAAERASIFLASKIPQTHQPGDSLTPQLEKPRVTAEQMASFMRYAKAADDPLTVLDDMEHGRLTSEGVEAMQMVAPKLYEEVRTKLGEQLAQRGSKLPAEKEIQIRLFFNLRTGMLAPDYVAMFQGPPPAAPGAGGPKGNSKGALSVNLATDAQHAQAAPLGSK